MKGDLLAFLKFSKLENQDLKLLKKPNVVLFVQDFLVAATTKNNLLDLSGKKLTAGTSVYVSDVQAWYS